MSSEEDSNIDPAVIVTVDSEIITENGAFETFQAGDYMERTNCIVFLNTTISNGTIRVQKPNLRSVIYL